jgi:iron complex outermembrane recepter protein
MSRRLLPLASLFIPSALLAQTTPKDTAKLATVTTVATRSTTPLLTTPLAVTRIDEADLRATNGYGLEDALRLVPGVIAQSRYGTSDVRLIIRGFGARGAGDRSNSGTSRGVRVLLDGFPETEPDGRTAFDHVDLQTATSAEVVRSNASSLWGNAAGGVVNLSSIPSVERGLVDVQPIVGSFGLKRVVARTAAPLGNGSLWMNFTNTTFDGWRTHSDARRFVLNAGASGNMTEKTRLGVFLVAANNLMRIPGPLTQAEMDADPSQANPTYVTRDERRYNRQGRLGLALDHQFNAATSVSSAFYVNPKYLQRSERGTYRDFTRYHLGGNAMVRRSLDLGETSNRFTLGVDEAVQDGSIQFYTLAANTRGALSDNKGEGAQNLGVFLQDEMSVNERLSLLLGARYDRVAYNYRTFFNPAATIKAQSKEFERVSPKLGISFRVGSSSALYANVGGGLEVPAGNETDQPPTAGSAGPLPGALLNPLLDAIRSTTYEAGFKSLGMSLADGAAVIGYDVALYSIDVENEIVPYNGGRYYQTAAQATRRGLEVGLNATTRAGLFATVAMSLNDHKYSRYIIDSTVISTTTTGTVDASDNDVMGVPGNTMNADVGFEVPGYRNLRLSANLDHSGDYFADDRNTVTVPGFTVYGLKAELRNPIVARNGMALRAFIAVHNLTDEAYVGSAFLNPDPGTGGQPAVFERGAPRSMTLSFSLGRQ